MLPAPPPSNYLEFYPCCYFLNAKCVWENECSPFLHATSFFFPAPSFVFLPPGVMYGILVIIKINFKRLPCFDYVVVASERVRECLLEIEK